MRAGAAGLRASGSRCDLRRRAALPPCRPRSVGRGGSAPSAPRSTRDVGQRPPPICESDRDRCTRPRRQRRLGEGREARVERGRRQPARPTRRTRIALGRSTAIARSLMCLYSPRRCSCAPQHAPGAGDDGRETIMSDNQRSGWRAWESRRQRGLRRRFVTPKAAKSAADRLCRRA
jgi:hypothetical protein